MCPGLKKRDRLGIFVLQNQAETDPVRLHRPGQVCYAQGDDANAWFHTVSHPSMSSLRNIITVMLAGCRCGGGPASCGRRRVGGPANGEPKPVRLPRLGVFVRIGRIGGEGAIYQPAQTPAGLIRLRGRGRGVRLTYCVWESLRTWPGTWPFCGNLRPLTARVKELSAREWP